MPAKRDETFQNLTMVLKSNNLDRNMNPTLQQRSQLESHKLRLLADIPPSDSREPLRTLFVRAYQTDNTLISVLQALV